MTTPTLNQTKKGAIDAGDRIGWLELARQQSQALAESEARRVRPWRWPALADGEALRRGAFLRGLLRPSWAAVTILVLILAGGVTLGAYLTRRSAPPVKKTAPAAKASPAPSAAAPARSPTIPTTVEPAEVVAAREELAPEPKRPGAAAKTPESKPAPEETIILGPDDTDGAGEMIIVPRPRTKKLEPLFTPDDYKKKGRRGTRF